MTAETYASHLEEAFQRCAEQPATVKYRIAGHVFALLFPSQEAAGTFGSAFDLADPDAEAEFTVRVWEGGGVQPAWQLNDYRKKGEVAGFNDSRFRLVFDIGAQALSMADLSKRRGYYWTPSFKDLPYWEHGAPLRNILHWLLPLKGKLLVHCAAVGTSEGGVMIVGKGGAGKSTTALSCLDTGLSYCGDDYCVLSCEEPVIYNAYSTAKVARSQGEEKDVLNVRARHPEKMIAAFPVLAVVLPIVADRPEPKLEPIGKGKVLRELAASTIFQLPGDNGAVLGAVSRTVRQLPCYLLHLSRDYGANARILETTLAEALCLSV